MSAIALARKQTKAAGNTRVRTIATAHGEANKVAFHGVVL